MIITLALAAALASTPTDVDCVRPKPIPSATPHHPKRKVTTVRYHRLFKTEPKPKPEEEPCEEAAPRPPVMVVAPPDVPDVPMVSIPDVPPVPPPYDFPILAVTPLTFDEPPPPEGYPWVWGGGGYAASGGFGGGGGGGGAFCVTCVPPCPVSFVPSPVPEPESLALIGLGLVLVGWRARA